MVMVISACQYTIDGLSHLFSNNRLVNFDLLNINQKDNINNYVRESKIKTIIISYTRFLFYNDRIDLIDIINSNRSVIFVIVYDMQSTCAKSTLKVSDNVYVAGKEQIFELFISDERINFLDNMKKTNAIGFSQKEKEIAFMLFNGKNIIQICDKHKISKSTLFTHISNMKAKAKYKSIQQLFYLYSIQKRLAIL